MPKLTPAVKALLILNVTVFLGTGITQRFLPAAGNALIELLALSFANILQLKLWTLLTYALLHSLTDVFHLLFNLLLLYLFGPVLETRWGSRRFLIFYGLCAVGGGIGFLVSGFVLGSGLGTQLVGASAAVLALIIAWGLVFPELPVYLFGILPLKGKHLLYLTVAIEVLLAVTPSAVSSAAHLGGMAMGGLLVTGAWRPEKALAVLRRWRPRRRRPKLTVFVNPGDDDKAPPGGWVQ